MVYSDFVKLCTNPGDKKQSNLSTAEKYYLKEALSLLSDDCTYQKLKSDPLPTFNVELDIMVEEAYKLGNITKAERGFLVREDYKIPYFYHISKVHKSLSYPPGHPIIASMGVLTSKIS